ncbi:hypothetical protein [Streptomyces sp. NPDC056244]|uniref:hypothetical protein n=1 Tax=Streptomyces sp. NPDC056244 TaxID=3345762 RepID=UPI0035DF4ACA
MRFVRPGALGVLAVVMAVFTPYVLRTESVGRAVAWSIVLIGTVAFLTVLVRAELLIRSLDRRTGSDASET